MLLLASYGNRHCRFTWLAVTVTNILLLNQVFDGRLSFFALVEAGIRQDGIKEAPISQFGILRTALCKQTLKTSVITERMQNVRVDVIHVRDGTHITPVKRPYLDLTATRLGGKRIVYERAPCSILTQTAHQQQNSTSRGHSMSRGH